MLKCVFCVGLTGLDTLQGNTCSVHVIFRGKLTQWGVFLTVFFVARGCVGLTGHQYSMEKSHLADSSVRPDLCFFNLQRASVAYTRDTRQGCIACLLVFC